jgi:hypothetical protein
MATSKDKIVLATGIPPWHASAFIGALLAVSVVFLPSLESLDELANIDNFTKSIFPDLISLRMLAILRLLIAISIWLVTFQMIFNAPGWILYTNYKPHTKLKQTYIELERFKTLVPFTSWSWIMLGLSYSFNAAIALQVDMGMEHLIQPWTLRCALILWELAAPFSLLVSAVIRYAIWPVALAGGKPHNLGSFRNQMMHNANSIYALSEMAIFGGLPMSVSHISIPCLVGCLYVFFAWGTCRVHGKPSDGPQYIYFFMDTTLERTTTIALAALVTTLVASFGVFIGIQSFVNLIGGNLLTNTLCAALMSSLVVRRS